MYIPDLDDPDSDLSEQLYEIVERMLHPSAPRNARPIRTTFGLEPPFDHSKPNEHYSKEEFSRELKVVSKSLKNLSGLIALLVNQDDEDSERKKTLQYLGRIVDYKLIGKAPRAWVANPFELVQKNVADVGGFTASLIIVAGLKSVFADRFRELKEQEREYWSQANCPPDHYARTIALRLARYFYEETGNYPTVGTSGETGDPSTSYSRALKEVFDLLEIRTGVRSPAVWAIRELTNQDKARQGLKIISNSLAS